jgi:3-isopropylmalate/(R)-2-methylmalate dehydratase small subunit
MINNVSSIMQIPDKLTCRVLWIFEDDFDVDNIIGPQNIKGFDINFLQSVCMKSYDQEFVSKVLPGDILVGGRNFGYGHPHYQAMITMRSLGINIIIAESFSPGFYRGEIYNGMLLITCSDIRKHVSRWDVVELEWKGGIVHIPSKGLILKSERLSDRGIDIVQAGGTYQLLLKRYGKSIKS